MALSCARTSLICDDYTLIKKRTQDGFLPRLRANTRNCESAAMRIQSRARKSRRTRSTTSWIYRHANVLEIHFSSQSCGYVVRERPIRPRAVCRNSLSCYQSVESNLSNPANKSSNLFVNLCHLPRKQASNQRFWPISQSWDFLLWCITLRVHLGHRLQLLRRFGDRPYLVSLRYVILLGIAALSPRRWILSSS